MSKRNLHFVLGRKALLLVGALGLALAFAMRFAGMVVAAPHAAPTPPPIDPRASVLENVGLSLGRTAGVRDSAESVSYLLNGKIAAFEIVGDRLYAGMGQRFVVFDISDPAQPQVASQVSMGGEVVQVFVVNAQLAYAVVRFTYDSDLYALDLSAPAPRIAARLDDVPMGAFILHKAERFFLVGLDGWLEIWDLGDPHHPIRLSAREKLWSGYHFSDALFANDALFVAHNDGLTRVDVSDPENPVAVANLPGSSAQLIDARGDWLYSLDNEQRLIRVLDISDPAQFQEKASIATGFSYGLHHLIVQGDRLYFVHQGYTTTPISMKVYDVSAPPEMTLLATLDVDFLANSSEFTIIQEGVLLSGHENGFRIHSLLDLAAPREIGGYAFPGRVTDAAYGGPARLYTVEPGLVTLLDVSNPIYPSVLWAERSQERWSRLIVGDRYLNLFSPRFYDGSGWREPVVTVYDRRASPQHKFVRRIADVFYFEGGLLSAGDLLIGVGIDRAKLVIMDVTREGDAAFIHNAALDATEMAVLALRDHMLFVRGKDEAARWGVYQYDIADPAHPRLVGVYRHPDNRYPTSLLLYKQVGYLSIQYSQQDVRETQIIVLRLAPDAPPESIGLYSESYWGTPIQGVIWNNRLLHTGGEQQQLNWADISDPEHPRFTRITSAIPYLKTTFDQFAFSVQPGLGLWVWRLPEAGSIMRLNAQQGGRTYAVAMWRGKALVARGHYLFVYDVTAPDQPELMAWSPPLPGQIYGLTVQNDIAYAALGEGGVLTLALSGSQPPRPLARRSVASFAWNVAVDGDRLYVADEGGYAIFDCSDPANLQLLKQTRSSSFDVAVVEHALARGYIRYVEIDDISDLNNIVRNALYPPRAENLDSDGRFFYAAQGYEGVRIYNPDYGAGYYFPVQQYPLTGYAMDFVLHDRQGYALDWFGALRRIPLDDISNPSPAIDTLQLPPEGWNVASDNQLALVSFPSQGFAVVETGDAMRMASLNAFDAVQTEWLWASTRHRVVTGAENDLYLLDLRSAPVEPTLAHVRLPARMTALSGVGETAYAGDVQGRLFMLDAREEGGLNILNMLAFDAPVRRILVREPLLFLLTGDDSLQILDIQSPARPTLLTTHRTPGKINAFAATRDALYLAVQNHGVQVLDIRDPAQPRLVETMLTLSEALQLAADDAHLAIWEAHPEGWQPGRGIEIFSLENPLHPTYRFYAPYASAVDKMLIHQGRLIIMERNGYIRQYQISVARASLSPWDVQLRPGGGVRDMAVFEDQLFAASHESGIQRYGVSTLWAPLMMQR
ncbi:MAG: hypothetical protein GXP42_14135 [Chloroflexi bacterium]|nr:hypothetical protein [Chloroflexota bacterium]